MKQVLRSLTFCGAVALSLVAVEQAQIFSSAGYWGAEIGISLALLAASLWFAKFQIDHPLFFFPLLFAIYMIANPALNALIPGYQDYLGVQVWRYHYIFLASYVVVIVLLDMLRLRTPVPRQLTLRPSRAANARLLFAILLVPIALFLVAADAAGVDRTTATGILAKGSSLYPIAGSVLLIYVVDSRQWNRNVIFWIAVHILAMLAVYLIMGNRSFIVKFVLALLIIYHCRYRQIDGRKVLPLILLAFLVAPLTKHLQSFSDVQDFLTDVFYREFKTSGRILYTYLDNNLASSYSVLDFGAEILNSLTFGLLGYATGQQALVQQQITQSTDVGLGYSVVLSSMNLMGKAGIVIVPALLAGTAHWLYRWRRRSTGWLFSYAVFTMAIAFSGRFELSFVIGSIIKQTLLILGVLAFLGGVARSQSKSFTMRQGQFTDA